MIRCIERVTQSASHTVTLPFNTIKRFILLFYDAERKQETIPNMRPLPCGRRRFRRQLTYVCAVLCALLLLAVGIFRQLGLISQNRRRSPSPSVAPSGFVAPSDPYSAATMSESSAFERAFSRFRIGGSSIIRGVHTTDERRYRPQRRGHEFVFHCFDNTATTASAGADAVEHDVAPLQLANLYIF